ncbi:hypothetical protein MAR_031660, partial [Mya arenaria]
MDIIIWIACTKLLALLSVGVHGLAPPSYVSQWMSMHPKDGPRELEFVHGFFELPANVEIQSSDDVTEDSGSVVYIYNETVVIVKCPDGVNKKLKSLTTGDSWSGKNRIKEDAISVRVRVWRTSDFPEPSFQSSWLPLSVLH